MDIDHNEADTRRIFITPSLVEAGWETPPHSLTEERTFTDGRIVVTAGKPQRGKPKRADYILRFRQDFPIAIVEARQLYRESIAELDTLVPSVMDQVFKGEI